VGQDPERRLDMLRRSLLFALALCALVSLAGCGADRLTGPQVGDARDSHAGTLGDHPRTDDYPGGGPGADPVIEAPVEAYDTLRTGDDGDSGRARTD
jgi:hypothetical protein